MRTGKENFVLGAISLVSNELNTFGEDCLEEITFKQWFLLMMISKMEKGEKSVNLIADFTGTSRQNVKKMLTPLEKKGFVSITGSENDGRALSVELTDKTYKYFFDHDGRIAKATERLFSAFSDAELDLFAMSFKKLITALDEEK